MARSEPHRSLAHMNRGFAHCSQSASANVEHQVEQALIEEGKEEEEDEGEVVE